MMDRIIFLGTGIDDQIANIVQAQLFFLESADASKDIQIYELSRRKRLCRFRNYDTMQYIKPDVATICTVWLLQWERYCYVQVLKKRSLPHSRVMIHQPSGGTRVATDMEINLREMLK
jgi:ATP-dependent Clp protease protease subunit